MFGNIARITNLNSVGFFISLKKFFKVFQKDPDLIYVSNFYYKHEAKKHLLQ